MDFEDIPRGFTFFLMPMKPRFLLALALLVFCRIDASSQEPTSPQAVVDGVVKAANALMEKLDPGQRSAVAFPFASEEQRRNWSNLPTGIYRRKGLRMGDLNPDQKEAVLAVVKATMSPDGFQQVIDNMAGDEWLHRQGEPNNRIVFGADEYYFSLLGEPSSKSPWMWQFGGHHLAINATLVGDRVTLAPSLTGGQPIDFEIDGRKVRQMADEEDAAYRLIDSLTAEELKKAVVKRQYDDLQFGPTVQVIEAGREGILAAELNEASRKLLVALIRERVRILNEVHARQTMEKLVAELPRTYFAWHGPTQAGQAASYRIQGPSLIIEYTPQRLGGKPTDHIHAMYRDPGNDYGIRDTRTR